MEFEIFWGPNDFYPKNVSGSIQLRPSERINWIISTIPHRISKMVKTVKNSTVGSWQNLRQHVDQLSRRRTKEKVSKNNTVLLKIRYSYLSNKRIGYNKRVG